MNIHEIQNMCERDIYARSEEYIDIKGHRVYFVDLGGNFGYSALVCADCMHIYYADDFELHHQGKTRDELREFYIKSMNGKLFTEDELRETSDSFDELTRKRHYLGNYYSMRRPYVSAFHIGKRSKEEEEQIKGMRFSPVGFAYYDDEEFVEHMNELAKALDVSNDPLRDYEHAKDAFKYEMWNHEYPINWQGDWDVINCFTKVEYAGDGSEIHQTDWSDEIKRAYWDAASEVNAKFNG